MKHVVSRALGDSLLTGHVALCVALGMALTTGHAAPVDPTEGQDTRIAAAELAAPGHESEAVTTAKCLADLASPVVNDRRRAVMILGKYRSRQAMSGVMGALRDADGEVRRSALVSVSEWPAMPAEASAEVLSLLSDADIHVRRLASSMLPDVLVGRMPVSVAINTDGEIRQAGRTQVDGMSGSAVSTALNRALMDEDVTVKRNVLSMAPYLPGVLDQETLELCLGQADAQVRVLAVRAFSRLQGGDDDRAETLSRLVEDPDVLVRREVTRALGRLGAAGFNALESLSQDTDPGVRLDAVRALVEKQHPRGLELLRTTVLDESLPASERRVLVLYAGLYEEESEALLLELVESQSAALKTEAIRALGRAPASARGPEFYARYLEDPSGEVRESAAQVLSRLAGPARHVSPAEGSFFTAEGMGELLESPYADVRLLAVRLGSMLAPSDRDDLLIDACMDNDVKVRSQAIRRLAMGGTDAGFDIAVRSLEDPDETIVMAALQGLSVRPSAAAVKALGDFAERCQNPATKSMVSAALLRLKGRAKEAGQTRTVLPAPGTETGPVREARPRWPLTEPSPAKTR